MKQALIGLLAVLLGVGPVFAETQRPKHRPVHLTMDRTCPEQASADQCMKCAIYHEARGEHEDGQIAVALVILNRVASKKFPNTICEVVWQKGWVKSQKRYYGQLSFTTDGKSDYMAETDAIILAGQLAKIAQTLFDEDRGGEFLGIDKDVLWYHTEAVSPRWSKVFVPRMQIGTHQFYAQD